MPPARFAVYAASAGVLVMTARALAGRAPPFGWAFLILLGYTLLILGGVFVLRWRVFVDAVVRGPRGARGVALTFDDGPDPVSTPRILDALAVRGARATFFVVGRKVEQHPEVVRAIVERGHAVGLHSYAHDRLFALRGERRVRADLARGIAALEKVTGERPILFRPPIGHTNPILARVADSLDLTVVGWSVGARDGLATAKKDAVAARVCAGLRDGAIVLMHDAPETGTREPAAVGALPIILDAVADKGLEVVPLAPWVDGAAAEKPRA
ncbi:MAG TPA: polysaccharide deacetylase family protein [Polyangiaceae bacterium]|jgi:peptidoglycan/xylan/chitin deacetylase (PgdA/CDA1 family)